MLQRTHQTSSKEQDKTNFTFERWLRDQWTWSKPINSLTIFIYAPIPKRRWRGNMKGCMQNNDFRWKKNLITAKLPGFSFKNLIRILNCGFESLSNQMLSFQRFCFNKEEIGTVEYWVRPFLTQTNLKLTYPVSFLTGCSLPSSKDNACRYPNLIERELSSELEVGHKMWSGTAIAPDLPVSQRNLVGQSDRAGSTTWPSRRYGICRKELKTSFSGCIRGKAIVHLVGSLTEV